MRRMLIFLVVFISFFLLSSKALASENEYGDNSEENNQLDVFENFEWDTKASPLQLPIITDPGTGSGMTYPGRDLLVRTGDILYSSKSASTAYVGHVGIVGSDGKVRHIIPDGKHTHTITGFRNSFGNVTILRHKNSSIAYNTGKKSEELYRSMTRYRLNGYLNNVQDNHCTKFVWQSFYYGNGRDHIWHFTDRLNMIILPSAFKDGHNNTLTNLGGY